jgi:hypothetical protein
MIAHPPQYPIFYNGIKDIITHGADGWHRGRANPPVATRSGACVDG